MYELLYELLWITLDFIYWNNSLQTVNYLNCFWFMIYYHEKILLIRWKVPSVDYSEAAFRLWCSGTALWRTLCSARRFDVYYWAYNWSSLQYCSNCDCEHRVSSSTVTADMRNHLNEIELFALIVIICKNTARIVWKLMRDW